MMSRKRKKNFDILLSKARDQYIDTFCSSIQYQSSRLTRETDQKYESHIL